MYFSSHTLYFSSLEVKFEFFLVSFLVSHYFKIQNIVITVSMYFSAHSNIFVSSGSGWIECFFILVLGCIFLPLCMSGDFWLDAKHCVFYLAGCLVFFIPINIMEFCSGIELILLENSSILFGVSFKICWVELEQCLV